MSKLLTALVAGLAAFAINATAAEQARDSQSRDNQTQAQPNATQGKPTQNEADRTGPGGSSSPSQAGASDTNRTGQPRGAETAAESGGRDTTDMKNQTPNQANQAGADEGNMGRRPNQPGGRVNAQEREYLADIEKCNAMSGSQKTQCMKDAKKRAGQM